MGFFGNTFNQPVNILLQPFYQFNGVIQKFDKKYTTHNTIYQGDITKHEDDVIRKFINPNGFDVPTRMFKTVLDSKKGFFRTIYFKFAGRYPVLYYSNHPANIPSAIKRYVKCPKTFPEVSVNFKQTTVSQVYAAELRANQLDFYETVYTNIYGYDDFYFNYMDAVDVKDMPRQILPTHPATILCTHHKNATSVAAMCRFLKNLENELYFMNTSWLVQFTKSYTDPEAFRIWYAQQPCAKKAERMTIVKFWSDFTNKTEAGSKSTANLKNEGAKWDAYARIFVSYGETCLYLPWAFTFIKQSMEGLYCETGEKLDSSNTHWFAPIRTLVNSHRYTTRDHEIYIYGDVEKLRLIFQRHYDVSIGLYGDHSYSTSSGDDMINTVFEDKSEHFSEQDVTACDSSHSDGAFLLTTMYLRPFVTTEMILNFISTHMKPITLVNPHNRDESVQIRGLITSGSGTTDTTPKNNGILLSAFFSGCDQPGIKINWSVAFQRLGYVVKDEPRVVIQGMLFLKNFCYIVDDVVYVTGCLGKIIKNFGTVDGNLLPTHFPTLTSKEFKELLVTNEQLLADWYFGSVMEGYKNEPSNVIIDALRSRFPPPKHKAIIREEFITVNKGPNTYPAVPTEQLKLRYDFEDYEISEMVQIIHDIKIGIAVTHSGFGKIMEKDYGFDL
jgi:hypothetical protein